MKHRIKILIATVFFTGLTVYNMSYCNFSNKQKYDIKEMLTIANANAEGSGESQECWEIYNRNGWDTVLACEILGWDCKRVTDAADYARNYEDYCTP